MTQPNLRSILYTISEQHIQTVIEQSVTAHLDTSTGDQNVDMLVAALRMGRPIQCMTTLRDGSVLFSSGHSTI